MKKVLTLFFAALMLAAFIACGCEDAEGKIVMKVAVPAMAVAWICAIALRRLVKDEK